MFRHWLSAIRHIFQAEDRPTLPPAPLTEAERLRAKIAKWTREAEEFERLRCSIFAREARERIALYARHLAALDGSPSSKVA